jgi:UDP-N-acetyl-2-amino-2-deoxyglucuronate dehydrogenase
MRCAIVGAGAVVEDLHLSAFRGLRGVELAAVCEPDPERLRRIQAISSVPRAYESLDELIAREPPLDFVDIATPAHTHYELVKQALDAGLNVLVEKPLALTAEEGADLDRLAQLRGRKLSVLQTYRFRTPALAAEQAIGSGSLGTITKIGAAVRLGFDPLFERRGWDWGEKGTRLLLYELGIHYVDLAVHYAGPVRKVLGFHAMTDPTTGGVTAISALLQHEGGAVTDLDLAFMTPSRFIRLDLFGTSGHAVMKLWPESFASWTGQIHPLKELKSELRRTKDFVKDAVADRLRAKVKRRAVSHFRLMEAFVAALEDPAREVPVTAASAVQTLEALDALHDEIRTARPVEISRNNQEALERAV